MPKIYTALTVATITELKALTSSSTPAREDGAFYSVTDAGNGFPGWYRYFFDNSDAEKLPDIIEPLDSIGRYLQYKSSGGGKVIIPFSPTVTADLSEGNHQEITLEGNISNFDASNIGVSNYEFVFIQDSGGGRTVQFSNKFRFPGGTAPEINTNANSVNLVRCVGDGANLLCHSFADLKFVSYGGGGE